MKFLIFTEIKKNINMLKSYKVNFYITIFVFIGTSIIGAMCIKQFFFKPLNFFSLLMVPIITSGCNSFSNSYKFDTMIGVIEQIWNSTYGIFRILLARYCVDFIMSISPTIFLIILGKHFFSFHVHIIMLIIVLAVLFISCASISLLLLGIILIYRNISSIEAIMNFLVPLLLIIVMVAGLDRIPYFIMLLPFSSIFILPSLPFLSELPNMYLIITIVVNSFISVFLSIIIFKHCYIVCRKIGTIGLY